MQVRGTAWLHGTLLAADSWLWMNDPWLCKPLLFLSNLFPCSCERRPTRVTESPGACCAPCSTRATGSRTPASMAPLPTTAGTSARPAWSQAQQAPITSCGPGFEQRSDDFVNLFYDRPQQNATAPTFGNTVVGKKSGDKLEVQH